MLTEYDRNVHRMLVSLATGTGKTIVFSKLYEKMKSRLPGQMLVLAHTEELVWQNYTKMCEINPTAKIEVEMAGNKADPSTADIIMASVPTLGRKGTSRVDKYNWEKIDKLVIDEAHHAPADSYRRIIDLCGCMEERYNGLLLGVTATPQRSDGKALAEIFEKVAYIYSIRQAIKDGWLVDVKGYCVKTDTDITDVSKTGGDFAKGELEDRVNNPTRNSLVVQAYKRLALGRPTVAFCVGIDHAKKLAEAFNEAGVMAEAIWGDDPDRAEKLAKHRAGGYTVLCNCGVLVEGYDDWRISCVLLARPTQSGVLFTQMVGRGTRLQEGTGNLLKYLKPEGIGLMTDPLGSIGIKSDCIVIDVVDVARNNTLVTLPTLMGLSNGLDLKGKSLVYAVEKIEELQEKYPSADFNKLSSLDDIDKYISTLNMFEVRFPAEVEANSELTWFRTSGGGYRIHIPKDKGAGNGGHVSIFQNMLDQWEIDGFIDNKRFHGTGTQMENAFKACDEQIRKRAPYVLNIISRKAKWHGKKATENQLKMLRQLFPYRQIPDSITAGEASKVIGERLARKAKR